MHRSFLLALVSFGCAPDEHTTTPGGAAPPPTEPTVIEPSGGHPFELLGALEEPGTHAFNAVEWIDGRYALSGGGGAALRVIDTLEPAIVVDLDLGAAADVAYDETDGSTWVAVDEGRALLRYDLTDPLAPVFEGSFAGLRSESVALAAHGGLALLGTNDSAVLFDQNLQLAAELPADRSHGVALHDGRALVANGAELVLWDVTRPSEPQVLDTFALSGEGRGLAFDGAQVAAALGCGGVDLLEVVDDQLVSTGHIDLPNCTFDVDLDGDMLWIAAWSGVWLARLDDTGPVLLGEHPSAGSAGDVAARDGVAVVAELGHFEVVGQVSDVGGPEITTPATLFFPRQGGTRPLVVRNDGSDLLDVRLTSEDYTLSVDRLALEPGASRTITVTPPSVLGDSVIEWTSSDPSEPGGVIDVLLAEDSVGEPQPAFEAQAFTWPNHDLKPVDLATFEGSVVYLSFFRPSCLICTVEAPDIYAVMQNYVVEHEDFRPVWVAVKEDLRSAWSFMDEFEMNAPCLVDTYGTLYNSYGQEGDVEIAVPMNVVVDRQGVVTYLSMETNVTEIQGAIEAALGVPSSNGPPASTSFADDQER